MNNLINNAINYAYGFNSGGDVGLSELDLIKKKVHEKLDKEEENNNLSLRDMTFEEYPLGATSEKRIQEIIDAIKELSLPLKIYAGTGTIEYWSGADLTKKETTKIPVFKLVNEFNHQLIFKIIHPQEGSKPFENYGRIHVVLYLVENDDQGSFYKANYFFNKQIKPLLLNHIGYNVCYGRATYSSNTTVKGNPDREDDWRWQFKFVGWDSSLKPIYINRLLLFYLRLGFVMDIYQQGEVGVSIHEVQARQVVLLSDAAAKRTREIYGKECWRELNKYNRKNNKAWAKLQRRREQEIKEKAFDSAKQKEKALKEVQTAQEILKSI